MKNFRNLQLMSTFYVIAVMDISKIYFSSHYIISLDNLIYAHVVKCCLLAERLSNLYLYPNLAIELHCH